MWRVVFGQHSPGGALTRPKERDLHHGTVQFFLLGFSANVINLASICVLNSMLHFTIFALHLRNPLSLKGILKAKPF